MVEKEIWMHMLAYNLIRGLMSRAAEVHGKEPRSLSFKGTLQGLVHGRVTLAAPQDDDIPPRELLTPA